MTIEELKAFAAAHWHWLAGALLAFVLALSVWMYGRAQYARGESLARAAVSDSIGKAYEARYAAMSDSLQRKMESFQHELIAERARADAADARAEAVIANEKKVLTPQIIAQTPPAVLALLAQQDGAMADLRASNRGLTAKLDSIVPLMADVRATLAAANATIDQQRNTIGELQKAKELPHGFWHDVGIVSRDVGLVIVGGAAGKAIFH